VGITKYAGLFPSQAEAMAALYAANALEAGQDRGRIEG